MFGSPHGGLDEWARPIPLFGLVARPANLRLVTPRPWIGIEVVTNTLPFPINQCSQTSSTFDLREGALTILEELAHDLIH